MSLRNVLAFLAAAQVVATDSSHPMHFRKVDAHTAKGIATMKYSATPAPLVDEQVRCNEQCSLTLPIVSPEIDELTRL